MSEPQRSFGDQVRGGTSLRPAAAYTGMVHGFDDVRPGALDGSSNGKRARLDADTVQGHFTPTRIFPSSLGSTSRAPPARHTLGQQSTGRNDDAGRRKTASAGFIQSIHSEGSTAVPCPRPVFTSRRRVSDLDYGPVNEEDDPDPPCGGLSTTSGISEPSEVGASDLFQRVAPRFTSKKQSETQRRSSGSPISDVLVPKMTSDVSRDVKRNSRVKEDPEVSGIEQAACQVDSGIDTSNSDHGGGGDVDGLIDGDVPPGRYSTQVQSNTTATTSPDEDEQDELAEVRAWCLRSDAQLKHPWQQSPVPAQSLVRSAAPQDAPPKTVSHPIPPGHTRQDTPAMQLPYANLPAKLRRSGTVIRTSEAVSHNLGSSSSYASSSSSPRGPSAGKSSRVFASTPLDSLRQHVDPPSILGRKRRYHEDGEAASHGPGYASSRITVHPRTLALGTTASLPIRARSSSMWPGDTEDQKEPMVKSDIYDHCRRLSLDNEKLSKQVMEQVSLTFDVREHDH